MPEYGEEVAGAPSQHEEVPDGVTEALLLPRRSVSCNRSDESVRPLETSASVPSQLPLSIDDVQALHSQQQRLTHIEARTATDVRVIELLRTLRR